jgi:hypothetical protein
MNGKRIGGVLLEIVCELHVVFVGIVHAQRFDNVRLMHRYTSSCPIDGDGSLHMWRWRMQFHNSLWMRTKLPEELIASRQEKNCEHFVLWSAYCKLIVPMTQTSEIFFVLR